MSTIGERLVELRNESGLNQTDFAELGGVKKHTQINYEKGDSHPDIRYLQGIMEHGIDVWYLLTGQRGGRIGVVEENLPAAYRPSHRLAAEISKLALADDDVEIIINLAKRLSCM